MKDGGDGKWRRWKMEEVEDGGGRLRKRGEGWRRWEMEEVEDGGGGRWRRKVEEKR